MGADWYFRMYAMIIFRIIDENWSKNTHRTMQTQNFKFKFSLASFFTLDDINLGYAHRTLSILLDVSYTGYVLPY